MENKIKSLNNRVIELSCAISNIEDDIENMAKEMLKAKVGENQWLQLSDKRGCCLPHYPNVWVHKVMLDNSDNLWLNSEYEETFYDLCIEDKISLYCDIVKSINF